MPAQRRMFWDAAPIDLAMPAQRRMFWDRPAPSVSQCQPRGGCSGTGRRSGRRPPRLAPRNASPEADVLGPSLLVCTSLRHQSRNASPEADVLGRHSLRQPVIRVPPRNASPEADVLGQHLPGTSVGGTTTRNASPEADVLGHDRHSLRTHLGVQIAMPAHRRMLWDSFRPSRWPLPFQSQCQPKGGCFGTTRNGTPRTKKRSHCNASPKADVLGPRPIQHDVPRVQIAMPAQRQMFWDSVQQCRHPRRSRTIAMSAQRRRSGTAASNGVENYRVTRIVLLTTIAPRN